MKKQLLGIGMIMIILTVFMAGCVSDNRDTTYDPIGTVSGNEVIAIYDGPSDIGEIVADERFFWDIISSLNITHTIGYEGFGQRDYDLVIPPLVAILSGLSDREIFVFHETLAMLLYQIDCPKLAYESAELAGRDWVSGSSFLFARAAAIVNGEEHYNQVLRREVPLNDDLWFEHILYAAGEAWGLKHGRHWIGFPFSASVIYETGSNYELWGEYWQREIIPQEQLVGVWRTEGFEQSTFADITDPYAAIYITEDGNLYVLLTTDTSNGHSTDILHYHFEAANGHLILTPISSSVASHDMDSVWIVVADGNIYLDMREVRGWVRPNEFMFTLYKFADDVPYGWSDADRQEIQEINDRVEAKILAFAERFSEALGLPVVPYDGRSRMRGITFVADDKLISIEFWGQTPTPTRPLRHIPVPEPSYEEEWMTAVSANRQFGLFYGGWGRNIVTEEWFDIFATMDDVIDW